MDPTDVFTTRQLVSLVEFLHRPRTFLLDGFFPNTAFSDTDVIDFDIILKGRKLAPFVSPNVAGRPMLDRGQRTETFKPAYVKPKTPVDLSRPLKRRPGERYAGAMSAQERHDQIVMDIMSDQMEQVIRRKEWMAAQALLNGSVTIQGEDYPPVTIDFGRASALSIQLLSTARWGESGVSPMDDIEDWAGLVQEESGAIANQVILEKEAAKFLKADTKFKDALDNRRQAGGEVQLGPVIQPITSARYLGNIGDFDFWQYQDIYEDDAGTVTKLLPAGTVILGGADIEGVQAHGAIMDPKAGFQAIEFYPKNWIEDDPAKEFVMTQSSPLVVPAQVNASLRAFVRDDL